MKIRSLIIGSIVFVICGAEKSLLGQPCSLHQHESVWKYGCYFKYPYNYDSIDGISIFKVKDTVLHNGDTLELSERDSAANYDTTYELHYIVKANSVKIPYCSYWEFLPCDTLTPPCGTLLNSRIHGAFTPLMNLPLRCGINMSFHAETLCCYAHSSSTCSEGDSRFCFPDYREYYAQGIGLLYYWDHWSFHTVSLMEYNGLTFSDSWYDSLLIAAFPPSQNVQRVGQNKQHKVRSAVVQRQLISRNDKIVLTIWDSEKKRRFAIDGRSFTCSPLSMKTR